MIATKIILKIYILKQPVLYVKSVFDNYNNYRVNASACETSLSFFPAYTFTL